MTYKAACILYYKWLGQPSNQFMLFIPWYHDQGIEIEPDARTKALIEATGYPGHTIADDIVAFVNQMITDAIYSLTILINRIGEGVSGAIASILAFFNGIWAALANIVSTVLNIIKAVISGIVNTITAVGNWITTTIGLIVDKIVDIVNAVADWLKNLYAQVKEAIIGAFNTGIDAIKIAIAWIGSTIKTVLDWIWEALKKVKDWIVQAVKTAVEFILKPLTNIIQKIVDAVKATGEWIGGIYDSIGGIITNMVEGIKEGFKIGLDSVIVFLQNLWGMVTALLDSVFDLSVDALTEVFISIFSAQKAALDKLMTQAVPA